MGDGDNLLDNGLGEGGQPCPLTANVDHSECSALSPPKFDRGENGAHCGRRKGAVRGDT